MFRKIITYLLCLTTLIFFQLGLALPYSPQTLITHPSLSALFIMTNHPNDNKILMYSRLADGSLVKGQTFSTGGKGSGGALNPLESQNALITTKKTNFLLAVNAGSNEISVFKILPQQLQLTDKVGSSGIFPISLTAKNDHVYVLNRGNAKTPGNISGFLLTTQGKLLSLLSSTRNLPNGRYSELKYDPLGKVIVLTDKLHHKILTYQVVNHGLVAYKPIIIPSSGKKPCGFTFDVLRHLIVAESHLGAISTYSLNLIDQQLKPISKSTPNHQQTSSWIVFYIGGFVYTSNTDSNTISAYKVWEETGKAHLIDKIAGVGVKPTELAISSNYKYIYSLNAGNGTVHIFKVNNWNGHLIDLGIVDARLPIYAQGMAAI